MMNDLEKHRERITQELLAIQKYFFSEEWEEIRSDIEYRLEVCEDYLRVDNHLVPELTESYNSMVHYMTSIMQEYYDKITSSLVKDAIYIAIEHNNQKFLHFPGMGESRDTKRYSKKDLYRGERQVYQNLLRMEEAYIKNIGQGDRENDNKTDSGLGSSLWSGIGFSFQS